MSDTLLGKLPACTRVKCHTEIVYGITALRYSRICYKPFLRGFPNPRNIPYRVKCMCRVVRIISSTATCPILYQKSDLWDSRISV